MRDMEEAIEGLEIVAREETDEQWENNTEHVDWNVINWNQENPDSGTISEASPVQDASDSEILEEMSEEDLIQLQILSGEKSAMQWADVLETRHEQRVQELETYYHDKTAEQSDDRLELFKKTLDAEIDFRVKLFYVTQAVETQVKQATEVATIPNKRSQQYQDMLAANMDSTEYLAAINRNIKRRRELLKKSIRELRVHEDVTRTDHPRHKELMWTACDTDTCATHYYKKMDGYFPKDVEPVYWPAKKGTEHLEAPIPGDKPSKN